MVEISCLTISMPLYKSYGRNDPRAKRPTGETTHLIRANRPTPKTRAKRPRAKRPGETTHGRNDPDSSLGVTTDRLLRFYPFRLSVKEFPVTYKTERLIMLSSCRRIASLLVCETLSLHLRHYGAFLCSLLIFKRR